MNLALHRQIQRPVLFALGVGGLVFSASAMAQQGQNQNAEQSEGSRVTVDEEAAEIQLNQKPTEVTAEQKKMQVEVESGDPKVTVDQKKPEVSVEKPEPEVSVDQADPKVVVKDAKPQVEVNQAEPQVEVKGAEPEVEIISQDASGNRKGQQQSKQQSQDQKLNQMNFSELKDKTIETSEGTELGSVDDIVASHEDGRAGFVVSVGGLFGIGSSKVFVPAAEAQLQGDKIVWNTNRSKEEIKQSKYDEENYFSVTDRYQTLRDVRQAEVSSRPRR